MLEIAPKSIPTQIATAPLPVLRTQYRDPQVPGDASVQMADSILRISTGPETEVVDFLLDILSGTIQTPKGRFSSLDEFDAILALGTAGPRAKKGVPLLRTLISEPRYLHLCHGMRCIDEVLEKIEGSPN